MSTNLATAIRTTVMLSFTWALAFCTSGRADWAVLARAWAFLVASGFATDLSWLCYFRALKLGEVSQIAPVYKLSVAMAILLAVIFLGERIQRQQGIGAALIVMGVMIMVVKF